MILPVSVLQRRPCFIVSPRRHEVDRTSNPARGVAIADRLGHRAELPQEPELVPGGPDLDDLPVGDPFDRDPISLVNGLKR